MPRVNTFLNNCPTVINCTQYSQNVPMMSLYLDCRLYSHGFEFISVQYHKIIFFNKTFILPNRKMFTIVYLIKKNSVK